MHQTRTNSNGPSPAVWAFLMALCATFSPVRTVHRNVVNNIANFHHLSDTTQTNPTNQ